MNNNLKQEINNDRSQFPLWNTQSLDAKSWQKTKILTSNYVVNALLTT